MVKIAVAGVSGRMGRNVLNLTLQDKMAELAVAISRKGSPIEGCNVSEVTGLGASNVVIESNIDNIDKADVLIDFTTPKNSIENLKKCADLYKSIVIGTTGFSDEQLSKIDEISKRIPVFLSYNTSIGVNLLLQLVYDSAKLLDDYGYDVEIIESHHRNKVDSPSGTAIILGNAIAEATNTDLKDRGVFKRVGSCGPRTPSEIGFSVIRAGDIIGEHTVMFSTEGERIEISHKASSRLVYAKGALGAAKWISHQSPGLYSMKDFLSSR